MKHAQISGKSAAVLLLIVLALASGLRAWQMDRPALWEDDYLNLDRALLPLPRLWEVQKWQGPADTPYDFQPPLSFALTHLALEVSRTSLAARAVSLAAGILAVWGMFCLGRRLFGPGPGLLAATLLCLSLFHVEYSRAIKAYGVFFCFSVWSTVFVHRAATRGRVRDWIGWTLTSTGMLYSAYIGLPAFVGQALWAGASACEGLWKRRPGSARQASMLAGAAGAAGAAYLPWLPAVFFLQRMFSDPGMDPLRRLSWSFARDVLAGFYSSVFPAPGWLVPAMLALAGAGVVWALLAGRSRELLLLALWTLTPTVSVLLSKSVMTDLVTSRHLFNLLGLVTILPAAGAWALGRLPGRGDGLAMAVGTAACLALCWPQVALLPQFYGRSISLDRDYFYWLWATAQPGEALHLEGWKRKSKAFGARWYLPGLYGSVGDFSGPGYRRLLIVENQAGAEPKLHVSEAATVADEKFGYFRTRTQRLGVLSRSPVPIRPDASGDCMYEDDFSTPRMLSDAFSATNVAPDLTLRHLAQVRASLPGEVVYRFRAPEGVSLASARLTLDAVLYKRNPDHPVDSRIEVLAGPDRQSLKQVGVVSWKDFLGPAGNLPLNTCAGYEEQPMYESCGGARAGFDLAPAFGRELWVALRFRPGVSEGFLELSGLRLAARTSPPEEPGASPFRVELANLLADNDVHPWRPGAAALNGLFAFAARPGLDGFNPALGGPGELRAFRAEHPGLAPVHVLQDASGQPAVLFYDPPLALSAASPEADVAGSKGFEVHGLILSGRMNVPSLRVGDTRVDIQVAAPRGSVLMLNPGGRGKLVWSPDFSGNAFGHLDFNSSDNIRPAPDADNDGGLTCRDDRPCVFTSRFVSALPIERVRLEWYPRVVADPAGKNATRLSYSTDDGKTFLPLEMFAGDRSGKWTALFGKHAGTLTFKHPVHYFLLKAELTGEAAQLWSHRRVMDRMWLEADLDARSVKKFALPSGDFPLRLLAPEGNDVAVRVLDKPVPLYDSIKDWR